MPRMLRVAAMLAVILVAAGRTRGAGPSQPDKTTPVGSPGADPGVELRLPPDLVFRPAEGGPAPVVFRHTTHAVLTGNNCLTCHPAPFKLLHPARKTSHDEMDAGKSCGICHNGKEGFATQSTDSCEMCHAEAKLAGQAAPAATAAPAAAEQSAGAGSGAAGGNPNAPPPGPPERERPAPPDVKLAAGSGSPGPVTFRHSSHREAKCSRCHPALFGMKASGKPLDYAAMQEGATCGACHNGREAFGVADSEDCDRCHVPEGATP